MATKIIPVVQIDKFDGDMFFLSNFYESEIIYEGIKYPTNEHAFQAAKTFDKNVRQAILLGINRDSLIEVYDKGAAITAELPINSESYLYNPNLQKYSYNPNQAKSILESAGWVNNGVVRNKKKNEENVNLSFTLLVNSLTTV